MGESQEVKLPGLGTAGYRWMEEIEQAGDVEVVTVEWQRGISAEEARGRPIGASAPERLTVTATAPGQAIVHLAQRRPWESGPPRAEHRITVVVMPP
ncbi:MAG TPA: protease inhibitor I42 family protein [Microlunatus sp.]|nr:protease inhibitor I42 family protein [Microlunatus sp.]